MFFLTPILSGVLLATSFIPFYPWALFFCLTPLWLYWLLKPQLSLTSLFFQAWLCQFCLNLIGFYWIVPTLQNFANLPMAASIGLFLICASLLTYYIPVSALIWGFLRKRYEISSTLALCLLVVLFYLGETFLPMFFQWNLGHPWLWAQWPGFQWAEFIGFSGLSAITLIFNAVVVWGFLKKTIKKPLISLVFMFSALHVGGVVIKERFEVPEHTLKVLAMQLKYDDVAKKAKNFSRKKVLDEYLTNDSTSFKEIRKGLC